MMEFNWSQVIIEGDEAWAEWIAKGEFGVLSVWFVPDGYYRMSLTSETDEGFIRIVRRLKGSTTPDAARKLAEQFVENR